MAKAMRTTAQATSNWNTRTGAAQPFWQSQAQAASWKSYAGSAQAEQNYATGVQAAVTKKSRQTGVNASSDDTWKAGINANAGRYSQGVTASQPKFADAIGKVLGAISTASKNLPARGPRGSSVNIQQRGTAIQTALAAQKGTFKSHVAKATS
jgi:hypothetical protein